MDKAALINKLEEAVQHYKEQLARNEGSTLSSVASAVSVGFESLKAGISGNSSIKPILEEFRNHVYDFEKALKAGDRELSAKLLGNMEIAIQKLKNKDMS